MTGPTGTPRLESGRSLEPATCSLRLERRKVMSRVSDEALYELDRLTRTLRKQMAVDLAQSSTDR